VTWAIVEKKKRKLVSLSEVKSSQLDGLRVEKSYISQEDDMQVSGTTCSDQYEQLSALSLTSPRVVQRKNRILKSR